MDRQMYLALAQAVAFAGVALLVVIACVVRSQPALIPILLFGSLALTLNFIIIDQGIYCLITVSLFMYAFLRYVIDRGQYPTNEQMIAQVRQIPPWARNTPDPDSAVESMELQRVRRHSYEWVLQNTGEKPLHVTDVIRRNRQEAANIETN